jgi:anti-sigma-K factor RskA
MVAPPRSAVALRELRPRSDVMNSGSMHPPRAYWREIIVVLAIKTAALALLYALFFAETPKGIPPIDHILLPAAEKGRSG